jgi:hypothetical protein
LVAQILNKEFIPIKVNCDRFDGMDIMDEFLIVKKPTIAIFSKKEIFRKVGFISAEDLILELVKLKSVK